MQRLQTLRFSINSGFSQSHHHWMLRNSAFLIWALCFSVCLVGCSVIDYSPGPMVDQQASWGVLPFLNHTETPQAGRRAEAITQALLYSRGVMNVQRYPASFQDEAALLSSDDKVLDAAMQWAKKQQLRYVLTGTVDEWRYKVGVDGEPAVGVTLQIIDLDHDTVIWSGVGSQSGWSREAVSAVAQKLIKTILGKAELM